MATLQFFDQKTKAVHNSHKFGLTLSPDNYGYWKMMIEPFLVTDNLFEYIGGSISCPSQAITVSSSSKEKDTDPILATQPNPDYAIWMSNDAHIRMLLFSTFSVTVYPHVQGNTSREVWLSLERAFAPHTASRKYTLKTQLLRLEMKPDETSLAYLTRAQEYETTLANIGAPMQEEDIVMLVISGLRDDYQGVKTTALSRQLVFNELHALLSYHEYMLKKSMPVVSPTRAFLASVKPAPNSTSGTPAPSADVIQVVHNLAAQLGIQVQIPSQPQSFYTNRGSTNSNRGRHNRSGGRRRGNFNNNNNGTFNQNNNQRNTTGNRGGPFSWASNQNTVYGSCNRCGIGHLPSHCPNRDHSTIRSWQPPSANFADYRSNGSAWLPETGSSLHVAPDLSSFDHSEAYYGADNLHVGNGKGLPILHIGSSRFYSPTKTFNLQNILHAPTIKQNLLSVQKFCFDNNVYFEFHASFFAEGQTSLHTISSSRVQVMTVSTLSSFPDCFPFQKFRFQPFVLLPAFGIKDWGITSTTLEVNAVFL
jgi:hypothetical protein